ncbi:MAG: hypothetical protein FWH07_08110 [Oscillospiraceae bacterium]|nr:hypothetical protein [Oscillospiraceae bacterium]
MANFSLAGLDISPSEFLGAFFEANETVCFRVFSDRSDTAFSGQKLEKEQGRYETAFTDC